MKLLILSIFSSLFYYTSEDKALCTEAFCKTYLSKNTCISLPEPCRTPNSTHSGIYLPHPGPCNCCDYCLENLAQGATCSKGDPTSSRVTEMCGPELSCQLLTNTHPTCEIMSTPCIEEQKKYDREKEEGTLGHLQLRPLCDRNGFYAPFACVPGEICYCMSKDGRRVFGEIPYTNHAQHLLKCKCSRSHDDALKNGNYNIYTPDFLRCQSQGDFDSLQCLNTDTCLCTDTEDGHPTYSIMEFVNISFISESTLPCFDKKVHNEGSYYRKCEAEYIKRSNILKKYEEEGFKVFGHSLPNCQLDGLYAPVQHKDNMKYCAAPSGDKLENFEISAIGPIAGLMNCKCARARSLITSEEKPECCNNGNYKQMQCRRGLCRCVDENGVQIEKELEYLERDKLSCAKETC